MALPEIVFVGGTPRGLDVLNFLLEGNGITHSIREIICLQEDDHETMRPSDEIMSLANAHGIKAQKKKRITDDIIESVEINRPALILCVGWRTIISPAFLNAAEFGCLGVHDSLLPKYRGFAPVNWAIINGERQWGVTLFHLSDGVDEGDIVEQISFPVAERATAPELYESVKAATVEVIRKHWDMLVVGKASRTAQNHADATFACARNPEDGRINWSATTTEIDRLVRGLEPPYPGAFTELNGARIVLCKAEPVDGLNYVGRIPGRVVSVDSDGVDVLTGDGVIRITEVMVDNAAVPASEVIKSVRARLV